jgi:hypothetical protein
MVLQNTGILSHHYGEDQELNLHCCENLKSHDRDAGEKVLRSRQHNVMACRLLWKEVKCD